MIVQGEEEYEVERVLDSRIRYGKLQYYVDWKGYGPHDRTWEPTESLENAAERVAEFHRDYPLRPSPNDLRKTPRRSSASERGRTVMNGS